MEMVYLTSNEARRHTHIIRMKQYTNLHIYTNRFFFTIVYIDETSTNHIFKNEILYKNNCSTLNITNLEKVLTMFLRSKKEV